METSPNIGYTWGKWEQNVIEFIEESHLLCFSWKWYGENKVHALSLPDFTNYKKNPNDDFFLVKELHKLFQEADILVAHNGKSFDWKMANMFFLKNKLPPVQEHKVVDTKLLAKSKFRFNSNKLDDLGHYLGLGRKINTGGFELWKGCLAGDMKAWKHMVKYNKQDVVLLNDVYEKLVPWCKHPMVYSHKECLVCGSNNIHQRGWDYQNSGKSRRKRLSCKDCGRWSLGELEKNI